MLRRRKRFHMDAIMHHIEEAFGIVLVVVVVVGAVVAVITFIGSGETYREIGRGGLSLGDDRDDARPAAGPGPGAGAAAGERDDEIRQMLAARNERRRRRGEAPVDVEEELAQLTAGAGGTVSADAGLREEVRQLVVARNERRVRAGKEPLDVEAEVQRQLRELT